MSTPTPPIPAAIDLLASYAENGAYIKPDGIKDAITIVLEELNRAAGEIVVLREQADRNRPDGGSEAWKVFMKHYRSCATCKAPHTPFCPTGEELSKHRF